MSVIDVPRKQLSPHIWEPGDAPKMRRAVASFCRQELDEVCRDMESLETQGTWLKGFRAVGSLCTNQFNDDASLDLSVTVDWAALQRIFGGRWPKIDELHHEFSHRLYQRNGVSIPGLSHGIKFHLAGVLNPFASDYVYDLLTGSWDGESPRLVGEDFSPDVEFAGIRKEAKALGHLLDRAFGALRVSTADYLGYYRALRVAEAEEDEQRFSEMLALSGRSLNQIKNTVAGINRSYDKLINHRNAAFDVDAEVQYTSSYGNSPLWSLPFVLWKYLERYGYIEKLTGLSEFSYGGESGGISYPTAEEAVVMRKIVGSVLDYPHATLDEDIWDLSGPEPVLREDVYGEISERFVMGWDAGEDLPMEWVEKIVLVGSIATLQYTSFSDIDIHLNVDLELLRDRYGFDDDQDLEEWLKDFTESISDVEYGDTKHPINYFIMPLAAEHESDAIYLLYEDGEPKSEWIKKYPELPEDFDPDLEFSGIRDDVQSRMDEIDLIVGEIKRDVIDVNLIQDYLEGLDDSGRAMLLEKMEEKLYEIEMDLEDLIVVHDAVKLERGEAFVDGDDTGVESYQHSKSWAPGNIKRKYLERYHYIALIKQLKAILEGGVTEDEVGEIADVLDISTTPWV